MARRVLRWVVVGLSALGVGCGGQSSSDEGPGGTAAGGSSGGGGTGGAARVICGGVPCGAGQDCCLADGQCFDPAASVSKCEGPTTTEPNRQGQQPCTASSQCASNEFCRPANPNLCLGPGYCTDKKNCGTSSGPPMCGCDGVTYPDVQTACLKGVTIIGTGECGQTHNVGAGGGVSGKVVTYCATDGMCPSGQACCAITGQCYDPAEPVLCSFPPDGASAACLDDGDCFGGAEYCKKEGCDGPGGCVSMPGTGSCGGELSPVCGCNGKSYTNADCAAVDGVNVASSGECE